MPIKKKNSYQEYLGKKHKRITKESCTAELYNQAKPILSPISGYKITYLSEENLKGII